MGARMSAGLSVRIGVSARMGARMSAGLSVRMGARMSAGLSLRIGVSARMGDEDEGVRMGVESECEDGGDCKDECEGVSQVDIRTLRGCSLK